MHTLSKKSPRSLYLARHLAPIVISSFLLLPALASASGACSLNSAQGKIQHVIYIQFDNTHFTRDNPNVPSDLEQMPHLLNFITNNGTLNGNDHTILISHTAGGILSSLTGVYPDRHGQTVSNSYVRTSSTGQFSFPSSFGYWTDSVSSKNTPTVPNMIAPDGSNIPAPWVPFTRAGCDFGAVATANVVLENTGTSSTGDVTKVFGTGSPQFLEAVASNTATPGTAASAKAQTDFVGFAIHCAQGSQLCAAGHDDLLPQEPNGYVGFKGVFGAKEVNPVLTGGTVLNDLLGNPITDPFGQPGFPGFDGMSAAVSLAYVAAMQEKGVPVTYAYISDAHDFHGVSGNAHTAFGPGAQGYVDQLKAYDSAFAAFFDRLASHGITKDNTLFVFTVDEGDHFVGVNKTNCDGVTTACVYGPNEIGEISVNIDTLFAEQFPILAAQFLGGSAANAFTVHGDDAPPFYLANKGGGPLPQTDPLVRSFERSIARLTAVNPYSGKTDRLLVQMADQTGMAALHMYTTGDPARNGTFVLFADANYFITDFPASTCMTCINPPYAWNHGDIQPEIARTWFGFVGPGVVQAGVSQIWTDHTDVRPSLLALLGLQDDYEQDGRIVLELFDKQALPRGLHGEHESLVRLGEVYKQLNGAFGRFALNTLSASTVALAGGSDADDHVYLRIESRIKELVEKRDALAAQIKPLLNGPATTVSGSGGKHNVEDLIEQAEELIERSGELKRSE